MSGIEQAPLQVYNAALIFSPESSYTRMRFLSEGPAWVKRWPKMVQAWSACLRTLEGHSSFVSAVTFSPNGHFIASASSDSTVQIWETQTGALRSALEGHSKAVRAVAFSPDSQLIASASHDKTVRLWDAQTGSVRSALEGHCNTANAITISPDG